MSADKTNKITNKMTNWFELISFIHLPMIYQAHTKPNPVRHEGKAMLSLTLQRVSPGKKQNSSLRIF